MGMDGLGKFSEEGSSVMVMAIVGGAVVPFIFGILADKNVLGLHYALILPVICYLYIIYYGLIGSKFERLPS
jgi:FHS family L-fucose permease-like MFS transporter